MCLRYPDVTVALGDLDGPEGNAFAVLGRVDRALREAGVSKEERDRYKEWATSGDYEQLLAVTRSWVDTGEPDAA